VLNRKPILSFYTNMPTPYQLDFFEALKEYFDLRVIYFTSRESDRQWDLSTKEPGYGIRVLNNNRVALLVQKKFSSFHFSNQIISLLRKDEADFVLVNGTYWSPNVLLALYISYKRNKKVAFWSEPVFPVKNRLLFLIKKTMLLPIIRYTHMLLAIGKQAELGYKKYGYKKPIYNIPYNINHHLFDIKNLDQDIFQKLVLKYKAKGEIILLSSGSLISRKGMDTVIKAFMQLSEDLNARLIIIGDGEQRNEMQTLINGNDRIELLGFQQKEMVPYWFNLADIFVFASRYDGWGLVINEAAAADIAIISSVSVGASADKLVNQHNAILLNAEDVEGFAEAMQNLIYDKAMRNKLVNNNKIVKTELSSEYNAKKLYDIYCAVK
jgi:glycosyltransferase involved in cell wall biosynthesis